MHSLAWPVSHLKLSSLATDTFTKPALKLDPWSFNRERAGASQQWYWNENIPKSLAPWNVILSFGRGLCQLCVAFLFTWIDTAQVSLWVSASNSPILERHIHQKPVVLSPAYLMTNYLKLSAGLSCPWNKLSFCLLISVIYSLAIY